MQYQNKFIYPTQSFIGSFFNFLLNNLLFIKIKRIVFYPFTKARLKSDIKNVVFLNWLVPIDKVKHLIPEHVKLSTYNDQVLLTVLTYKHGNFRPTTFNKIKFLFGSPLQSNWRFYILNNETFQTNEPTVYFIKNTISSFIYTIGSRVFSNILQSHLPARFEHNIGSTQIETMISPGLSNAPDLKISLSYQSNWQLPSHMKLAFHNAHDFIKIICKQDFAISDQPDTHKYSVAKINLTFSDSDIQPLEVKSIESHWLKNMIEDSECFAFIIKDLAFLTLGEKIITAKNYEHR